MSFLYLPCFRYFGNQPHFPPSLSPGREMAPPPLRPVYSPGPALCPPLENKLHSISKAAYKNSKDAEFR